MTIWIRNVERVVEDARASFAAGTMTSLPPLPVRANSTRRVPRVGVEEIFNDEERSSEETPQRRPRRVTLVSASPETDRKDAGVATEVSEPVQDRQSKTQSVFNLGRPITPLSQLQLDMLKPGKLAVVPTLTTDSLTLPADPPLKSPRLSAVIDPNAFFEPPKLTMDEEPVAGPSRSSGRYLHGIDSATEYERILLASSGVKRNGKGYESNISTSNIVEQPASAFKRNPKAFNSARRGMAPPPETPRKAVSVDELGALSAAQASLARKEDGNNTIKLMRRAFKALTGGTVSRRLSRAAM